MIKINNTEIRNLQEQVEYLTNLYPALTKQLPYNGPYESLDDIPDDVLVDNGTYLIGTESYTIYKYDESTEEFTSLGLFGAKGDKGDKGDTGETGATGDPGLQGETGESAGFGDPEVSVTTISAVEEASCEIIASGPDTAKVFTFNFEIPRGLDGTPGPAGEKGEKGDQGLLGPAGPKGEQGNTGATGAAAGFGTPRTHVTTVNPDEEASVSIETAGPDTAKVFTFNFEIPQGIQGEQGIQGIQGIQGNPNVIVIGENTYSGTTITLPTTTLTFTKDDGTSITSTIVILGPSA